MLFINEPLVAAIQRLGQQEFGETLLRKFIEKFKKLAAQERIEHYFLQISRDQGAELELGFFTGSQIVDVTCSAGKVFSCSLPFQCIQEIRIEDHELKWTLTIVAQSKFDYNVMKPVTASSLKHYAEARKRSSGKEIIYL